MPSGNSRKVSLVGFYNQISPSKWPIRGPELKTCPALVDWCLRPSIQDLRE